MRAVQAAAQGGAMGGMRRVGGSEAATAGGPWGGMTRLGGGSGGSGGSGSGSGGARGPKEAVVAGGVEGMMGIFSGGALGQVRAGGHKEGRVVANLGEARRRGQIGKAAAMQVWRVVRGCTDVGDCDVLCSSDLREFEFERECALP